MLRKISLLLILIIGCIDSFAINYVNGDSLFSNKIVHKIELIYINNNLLDSLSINNEYVQCKIKIDGVFFDSIGVVLRGASTFLSCYPKVPLGINLAKYKKSNQFDGIDRFSITNQMEDPTYLRNYLFSYFAIKSNTIASRVSFANVYLNGNKIGLYSIIENVNKEFIDNYFTSHDGNLYKQSCCQNFHTIDT